MTSNRTSPIKKISDISLGIVCPMANEGKLAEKFVSSVLDQCADFKKVTFFAVLDNVSTDNTLLLLRNLQTSESCLKVIWAPENTCVVDAYVRGYREALSADCHWILEIDAGFSHQPSEIAQFFEKMLEGYDCAFGSRFCKGGSMPDSPLQRKIFSIGGTLAANFLLGTKLKDMTSGFEIFSRQALTLVLEKGIYSKGHFFQTEIKFHCRTLKIIELPITYLVPSTGVSGSVVQDAFRNLFRLFKIRLTEKH